MKGILCSLTHSSSLTLPMFLYYQVTENQIRLIVL